MLSSTLPSLRCPMRRCQAKLSLAAKESSTIQGELREVHSGELTCTRCASRFPILAGVAVLVDDVREYLLNHVKGIARLVPDKDIPKTWLKEYREAKAEIQTEHIEEDLEAERVISLYLMNHYLRVGNGKAGWWKPDHGLASPVIDDLVRKHWDQGPFAVIASWMAKLGKKESVIELGCGVGGLYGELRDRCSSYLGVDGSFASIALARHLALGAKYAAPIRIPRDLLHGPVSAEPKINPARTPDGRADFVVGDLESLPVEHEAWGVSIALNAIDMLPEPEVLPRLQLALARKGGVAIQSCPYIWHAEVAAQLKKRLPKTIRDSASAVEWLYEKEGFQVRERADHVPWLFFKHARQLEVYSVHLVMVTSAAV